VRRAIVRLRHMIEDALRGSGTDTGNRCITRKPANAIAYDFDKAQHRHTSLDVRGVEKLQGAELDKGCEAGEFDFQRPAIEDARKTPCCLRSVPSLPGLEDRSITM